MSPDTARRPSLQGRGPGVRLPAFIFRAVRWHRGRLHVIDQTALPQNVRYLSLSSAAEVAAAIRRLSVRGAPAIGVAGAYGVALEAQRLSERTLMSGLVRAGAELARARPTAVNLRWAVERVMAASGSESSARRVRAAALREARAIERQETLRSLAMARHGADLIQDGASILTICNTGALAAPGLGTALGAVLQAKLDGKRQMVYVCETRPLLQGARLTALELERARVEFRVIVDSAAASVIARCQVVIVGADRIAANGDTANKVGTRALAILARQARVPFFVAAPASTFDVTCATGQSIPIEERAAEEVRRFGRCRVTPPHAPVYNPAFDVTPHGFITGFVTDLGVIRPPFRPGIRRFVDSARHVIWTVKRRSGPDVGSEPPRATE